MTLAIGPVPGTDEKSHVKQNIAIQQLFKNVGYMTNQRQTMTLEEFDVVGDGNTDDRAKIVTAFTTAAAAGAKLLGASGKTYKVVGLGPQMAFQGVNFDGNGCTFALYSVPANSQSFLFSYNTFRLSTTLAANMAVADKTVTVASATSVVAGDLITIGFTIAATGNFYQIMRTVTNVAGAVLTLDAAIPPGGTFTFGVDTSAVSIVLPSVGAFRNCTFDGTNMTASMTEAFLVNGCVDSDIEGLKFTHCIGDGTFGAGGGINQCQRMNVRNIRCYRSGTAGASDFAWVTSHSVIRDINSDFAFGFGPQSFFGDGCDIGPVIVNGPDGRGFKIHGGLDHVIHGGSVNNSKFGFNNVVVSNGTSECLFVGHESLDAPGSSGFGGGACLWLSDEYNRNNHFDGCAFKNGGWFEIYVGTSDTGNSFSGCRVTAVTPTYIFNAGLATFTGMNGWSDASPSVTVSLGNGDNNDVVLPQGGNVRVIGPTADFSINGVVAGLLGQEYFIFNGVNHIMTIKNQNAGSAAANRIFTAVGDYTPAVAFSSFTIKYDGNIVSWLVKSKNG